MPGEAPRLERCCFCIPLRRGLIGLGRAKLVIRILSIAYMILVSCLDARRYLRVRDKIILSAVCVFFLSYYVFKLILIVADHRNKRAAYLVYVPVQFYSTMIITIMIAARIDELTGYDFTLVWNIFKITLALCSIEPICYWMVFKMETNGRRGNATSN